MIMVMTSPNRRATDLYDLGDLIVNTRISQVNGVAEVLLGGAQTPAVRVVANPAELQTRSLGLEDVRERPSHRRIRSFPLEHWTARTNPPSS